MIKICDRGIGMPDDILNKIFDATASTSRPGTNNKQGIGFGMPIMKSYVEKCLGRVEVESKTIDHFPMDHGTCFRIFLKIAR